MWGLVTNAWLLIALVIATYSPFLSAHQEPTNRSSLDLPVVDVRATRASNAREDDVKIDTDWLTTAVEDIVKKALKTDQRPKTEPGPAPAASIIRKVGTGVFVQTLPTSGQRNKTSVLNVADRWSYTPYKRRVAWNISSSSVADRMRYNPIATLAEGKLMSTTKKPRTYPEQPTVGSSSIDPLQSTAGTPTVDQQYEETSSAAPSTTGPLVVSLSTPMAIEESTTTSANSTPVRTTKTATTEMTTGPTPAPERDEKLETDLERFLSSLLQRINGSGNTDTSSLHQSLTALLAAAEKPVSTTEPNLVKEWWNKDPALHFTELSLETADDEDGEDEFIGHRPPFVDDESPPVTTERELMAPSRPSFLLLQPRPVIAYSTWPTTTPRPTTTTSTSTTTARKTQQTSTRTTTKRLRPTTIASTSTTTAWKTERTSTRTTTQRPTTPRATIIPFFEDPEIDEPLPWQQATMPPIDNKKPITKPGDTNFVAVSIWNFVDGQLTLVGQESVDPAQLVSPAPPQESQPAAGTPLPPPNIPQSILDQLLLPLLVNRPPLSPVSTTRPPPPGGVGNPTPKPSFKLPPTSSPSGPPPPLSSSYGQPPVGPSPSYTAPSALSTGYGPPQVATSSSFARPPAPLPQQPYMLPPAATAPYGSFYQEAAYSIDNPLFEDSFPPVTTRRPATTTIRSRTTTRRGAATNRPAPNRQVTKTAFKLVPEPELKPPVLGYQSLPLNANLPDFIVDILLNRPVRPSASFSPPVRLRPSAVYNPPAPAAAKPDETHDPYLLKYTQASHTGYYRGRTPFYRPSDREYDPLSSEQLARNGLDGSPVVSVEKPVAAEVPLAFYSFLSSDSSPSSSLEPENDTRADARGNSPEEASFSAQIPSASELQEYANQFVPDYDNSSSEEPPSETSPHTSSPQKRLSNRPASVVNRQSMMALGLSMLPTLVLAMPAIGRKRRQAGSLSDSSFDILHSLAEDRLQQMNYRGILTSDCQPMTYREGTSDSWHVLVCNGAVPQTVDVIVLDDSALLRRFRPDA